MDAELKATSHGALMDLRLTATPSPTRSWTRSGALPPRTARSMNCGLRRVRSYRVAANDLRASDLRVGGAA